MGQLIIDVTDEQLKAVNAVVVSAQDWLQAAWDGKANKCTKGLIISKSDKNVNKLDDGARALEIKNMTLKTRAELDAEGNKKLNI